LAQIGQGAVSNVVVQGLQTMNFGHHLRGMMNCVNCTNGKKFISTNIGILNHDALFIYYRPRGKADYEDLSNLKANDFILQKFSNNDDSGLEINVGYDNYQSGCKKIFQK